MNLTSQVGRDIGKCVIILLSDSELCKCFDGINPFSTEPSTTSFAMIVFVSVMLREWEQPLCLRYGVKNVTSQCHQLRGMWITCDEKQTSKHPPEWIFSNLAECASLNQFLDREGVKSARELYMFELKEKLWSVLCSPLCLNVICKTYC